MHGNLLDMGVSIDHVEKEIGHGPIRVIGDDPGPTVLLDGGQLSDGQRSSSATAAMSRSRNAAPALARAPEQPIDRPCERLGP
jgi:hypothetical protein